VAATLHAAFPAAAAASRVLHVAVGADAVRGLPHHRRGAAGAPYERLLQRPPVARHRRAHMPVPRRQRRHQRAPACAHDTAAHGGAPPLLRRPLPTCHASPVHQ